MIFMCRSNECRSVCYFQVQIESQRDRQERERRRMTVTESEAEDGTDLEFQCVGNNKGTSAALVEL